MQAAPCSNGAQLYIIYAFKGIVRSSIKILKFKSLIHLIAFKKWSNIFIKHNHMLNRKSINILNADFHVLVDWILAIAR